MTQVVTVSPSTAAYAAQGYKFNARQGATTTIFEQKIHAWSEDAKVNGDAQTRALLTLIQPPALALALLTSTSRLPQVTLETAERIYSENTVAVPAVPDPATSEQDAA